MSDMNTMQNAIESFNPRLLRILERGTKERVVIPGNTKPRPPSLDPEGNPVIDLRSLEERQRDAVRALRYMANRLRALRLVLVKSDDPRGRLLYRTIVRNVDTRHIELVVEPRDAQLDHILSAMPDEQDEKSISALDELDAALKE